MYIVLETQTNVDGTVGVIPTTYSNDNEAQSKYHTVLSFAAVSEVLKHGAFLLTDDGTVIESRVYYHEPVPMPEEESNEG